MPFMLFDSEDLVTLHRPRTAVAVVKMIFTDVSFIEVEGDGLHLREVAPGWTPADVQAITGAKLKFGSVIPEIDFTA